MCSGSLLGAPHFIASDEMTQKRMKVFHPADVCGSMMRSNIISKNTPTHRRTHTVDKRLRAPVRRLSCCRIARWARGQRATERERERKRMCGHHGILVKHREFVAGHSAPPQRLRNGFAARACPGVCEPAPLAKRRCSRNGWTFLLLID